MFFLLQEHYSSFFAEIFCFNHMNICWIHLILLEPLQVFLRRCSIFATTVFAFATPLLLIFCWIDLFCWKLSKREKKEVVDAMEGAAKITKNATTSLLGELQSKVMNFGDRPPRNHESWNRRRKKLQLFSEKASTMKKLQWA